ncbi:hypothetical protein H0H93_011011 [Arthromyces matolae]|nr:hypothetical protein H0H93_011011 [Arthromyces matolae]
MALNMAYEEKPIDFSTLVGTYRWVWDTQADARQVEREIMPSILGKKDDEEGGFITLSILEGDAKSNDLGNVCGVFRYGSIKGSFKGIKPFRNDGNKEFPGVFSILHVSWEDEKQSLADDEQELWVTREKDDHGHAFVGMYLSSGCMGWASASWNVVGKRQKEGYVLGEGRWEGLSWEERERLCLEEKDDDEDEEEGEDEDEESGDDEDEEDDDEEGDSDDEDEDEDSDEEDKGEGEQKEVVESPSEKTTAKGEDKDNVATSTVSASRKRKASVSEVKNTRQKQK